MKINLADIRIDGGTQPRKDINEDIVSEYAEAMQDGDKFPPVVVFQDGANYWLADGFHRYHASKKVGYLEIEAETKQGTRRDAILHSVSANSKHGLRRTNADKRKAVRTLLEDEEWSQDSNYEIARTCKVSESLVRTMRKELSESSTFKTQIESTRKVKRGDQEYTVDTSNIGNGSPETDEDFEYDQKTLEKQSTRTNIKEESEEIEQKGIGIQKAHEAISKLKEIPPNDGLLEEGYDTVIQWINYNR